VWVLGVENLISAVATGLLTALQPLRELLPGVNAGSLVWALAPGGGAGGDAPPGVVDAVTGSRATVALALYVAAFAAAGAALLLRRDVR
jgi:ABC-2 type transport system permease protein